MRIKPIFAWYDLWVGAFYDRAKRRLYIFPCRASASTSSAPPEPLHKLISREPGRGQSPVS